LKFEGKASPRGDKELGSKRGGLYFGRLFKRSEHDIYIIGLLNFQSNVAM
jgi:hypothetical protein